MANVSKKLHTSPAVIQAYRRKAKSRPSYAGRSPEIQHAGVIAGSRRKRETM